MGKTEVTSEFAEKIDPQLIDNMKDEDLKILAHMLLDIRNNERKEMEYAKKQSRFAIIISIVCFIIVIMVGIAVVSVIPKLVTLIDSANTIVASAEGTLAEASGVLDNLNKVTTDLANQDIGGLFANVEDLVNETQVSVNEAMGKVMAIDIETLNSAIRDLQSVVEPLARLFGR